jgi:hypothetical protein
MLSLCPLVGRERVFQSTVRASVGRRLPILLQRVQVFDVIVVFKAWYTYFLANTKSSLIYRDLLEDLPLSRIQQSFLPSLGT